MINGSNPLKDNYKSVEEQSKQLKRLLEIVEFPKKKK